MVRDKGPHSVECATAEGGECHCDCHGAMHGVAHLPGRKHEPGTTVEHIPGGGYRVTGPRGLPPGGGTPQERHTARAAKVTVTATSRRAHTLTPTTAHRARQVRDSLPRTREDWNAAIPRTKSDRAYKLERAADYEGRAQVARTRRQELIDRIRENMRAGGASEAEIKKVTSERALRKTSWIDIRNAEETAAYWQAEADKLHAEAAEASDTTEQQLPRDAGGWSRMPATEWNQHLDNVLDVGHQALADIHAAFERDDQLTELRATQARHLDIHTRMRTAMDDKSRPLGDRIGERTALEAQLPKGNPTWLNDERRAVRRREAEIIREMLEQHRTFGGVHHNANPGNDAEAARINGHPDGSRVTGARPDWRRRLDLGESYFPQDWLRHSTAEPLGVISSSRAFYSTRHGAVALSTPDRDGAWYTGAFRDETDEVTVHELGHRMEHTVPGLTHLEFALVRRRSTGPDGKLETARKLNDIYGGGYMDYERAFEDRWKNAYAGKTYESVSGNPGEAPWEAFQVGLQDVFGRSGTQFGDDELQAFVLGALLTLA